MKKILYLFFILMFGFALAQEDMQEALMNSTMPSDEEIMETIQKYIQDPAQQEYLFKETKKNLEQLYSGKTTVDEVLNKQNKKQK